MEEGKGQVPLRTCWSLSSQQRSVLLTILHGLLIINVLVLRSGYQKLPQEDSSRSRWSKVVMTPWNLSSGCFCRRLEQFSKSFPPPAQPGQKEGFCCSFHVCTPVEPCHSPAKRDAVLVKAPENRAKKRIFIGRRVQSET